MVADHQRWSQIGYRIKQSLIYDGTKPGNVIWCRCDDMRRESLDNRNEKAQLFQGRWSAKRLEGRVKSNEKELCAMMMIIGREAEKVKANKSQ